MKPEVYEEIKKIVTNHTDNETDESILTFKILSLCYGVEYDAKIEAIDNQIKQISSTCNERLK